MRKHVPCYSLVVLFSLAALAQNAEQVPAQDRDSLPNTYLRGKHMMSHHPAPGGPHAAQKMKKLADLSANATSATSSCQPQSLVLSCLDSVTNFTGQFKAACRWYSTVRGHRQDQLP